jgi:hypothetical protein
LADFVKPRLAAKNSRFTLAVVECRSTLFSVKRILPIARQLNDWLSPRSKLCRSGGICYAPEGTGDKQTVRPLGAEEEL